MAVSMNFIWRSSSENCSERILPAFPFEKFFDCQAIFQLFSGSGIISQANVFISKTILPMVQYQLQLPEIMGVK
jgi:hypothetical protein